MTEDVSEQQENTNLPAGEIETFTNNNGEEVVIGLKDTIAVDFTYDYTEDPSEKAMRDGERIKQMLQFIHKHYSYFTKIFRETKGMVLSDYRKRHSL